MRKKVLIPIIVVIIIGVVVVSASFLILLNLPPDIVPGKRKALLVGSANDFYESEPDDDFNDGGTQVLI